MKPNFALDLSHDAIRLLHRTPTHWQPVGEAPIDDPAFTERLGWLRATALGLEPQGITTKLVLPASQILYVEVEASGTDAATRRRQIRAGLEGMTPYALEDLAFDWSGKGPRVQVAVVARETLEEAESFAADNRFAPLSFVAVPGPGQFTGEPFFGQTRVASALLPDGTRVERDKAPVRLITAAAETISSDTPDPGLPGPEIPAPGEIAPDLPGTPVPTGPEIPAPDLPQPEVPEPQAPEPDLPEPELPDPSVPEQPDTGPIEVPVNEPVEWPDTGPIEVPDSLPPSGPAQPMVMMQTASPVSVAATLAPVQRAPNRAARRSARLRPAAMQRPRILALTGGLVTAMVLVWLLAGLLPARTSTRAEDPMADDRVVAAASVPDTAQLVVQDAVVSAQTAPVLPVPEQVADQVVEIIAAPETATRPPVVFPSAAAVPPVRTSGPPPARPVAEARVDTDPFRALRHALREAEPQVFISTGAPALMLVETAVPDALKAIAPTSASAILPYTRPAPRPVAAKKGETLTQTVAPVPVRAAGFGPADPKLGRLPPRARPSVSAPDTPAATLAVTGSSDPAPKLAMRRAAARPAALLARATALSEAENPPVVVAMLRPRPRPKNFSAGVAAALAAAGPAAVPEPARVAMVVRPPAPAVQAIRPVAPSVAVVAALPTTRLSRVPATALAPEAEDELESTHVAPTIPTRASVAQQATLKDTLNLRRVNLIGVYGTSSNRRALVRLSNGRMQRIKIGDRLDGGQVAAIGERELRYVKSGRAMVLAMPAI